MTQTIVAQDLTAVTMDETAALALELFCTHYGMDWQSAIDEALATIRDLAHYAEDWDLDVGNAAYDAGDLDTALASLIREVAR